MHVWVRDESRNMNPHRVIEKEVHKEQMKVGNINTHRHRVREREYVRNRLKYLAKINTDTKRGRKQKNQEGNIKR